MVSKFTHVEKVVGHTPLAVFLARLCIPLAVDCARSFTTEPTLPGFFSLFSIMSSENYFSLPTKKSARVPGPE